jgi:archaellum component FlaC
MSTNSYREEIRTILVQRKLDVDAIDMVMQILNKIENDIDDVRFFLGESIKRINGININGSEK